jgi:hypothetical protein
MQANRHAEDSGCKHWFIDDMTAPGWNELLIPEPGAITVTVITFLATVVIALRIISSAGRRIRQTAALSMAAGLFFIGQGLNGRYYRKKENLTGRG